MAYNNSEDDRDEEDNRSDESMTACAGLAQSRPNLHNTGLVLPWAN